MKHLTAFLLLTVFLYNLVGVYPVAMWQQHQLHREAERMRRASLPDNALVRIAIARHPAEATSSIHWQEEHEFSYRGRLYDVVRQRATADSITYFCWHDHDEEKVLAGLTKHAQEYAHPGAGARESAKKAFSFLFKLTYLSPTSALLPAVKETDRQLLYPAYAASLCSIDATVPCPPPWSPVVLRG